MARVNKKILLISYNFPPMGGGGVVRTLKFCKYLPYFGWSPVVLTVKEHDAEFIDNNLFNEIPETIVYNSFSIDLPLIYKRLIPIKHKNICKLPYEIRNNRLSYENRFKKFIDDFFLIPDSRVGWIPFALHRAIKICRKEEINLIFSTGGPWTNHLIGLGLKKLTKLPWVSDFRDSWTTNPFTNYSINGRRRIEEGLERLVLRKSDKIITTTSSIMNELKNKYLDIEENKFQLIRNGFDRNDFCGLNTQIKNGFNIIHAGNFYSKRTPKFFLVALKKLLAESKISRSNIKVNLIGTVDNNTRKMIKSEKLEDIVQCSGNVSHAQSIKLMVDSDLLLLIVGTEESECPGKIYEYLAAQKPILSLSGKGEISTILKEFEHVTIASPKDVDQIKDAIYDHYLKKQTCDLKVNSNVDSIQRFDRKELTYQLSKLLNQLI